MVAGTKEKSRLSDMQRRILEAIRGFISRHDMPPTIREIGELFDLKSSTVFAHLKALERKGFLLRSPGKSRGIQVPDLEAPRGIPLLGRVPAGPLDLAVEQRGEYLDIDARMFGKGELFALRVKGDSMIEAGILDGDTVVVSRRSDADDGQIVVALIGEEATVKRLRKKGGAVMLQPANRDMKPLFFAPGEPEPRILGKVVGVLRKL